MNISSNKPPESQGPNRSAQSAQNVQKPASAEQTDRAAETRRQGPADRVNISDRSKEVADILSAVNRLPDVRDSRVEEIKRSVDAGTYNIDAGKVADAILKSI